MVWKKMLLITRLRRDFVCKEKSVTIDHLGGMKLINSKVNRTEELALLLEQMGTFSLIFTP